MKYILIADAGSTKTAWTLTGGGAVLGSTKTPGLNPATMGAGVIAGTVNGEVKPWLGGVVPDVLYYYGAGVNESTRGVIEEALRPLGIGEMHFESDLLGTCRAVAGHRAMIVGILGTGSNSCMYDGERIQANVPPLGFILGDEGSGASMGRMLVTAALRGELPVHITGQLDLDRNEVIERVYRGERPSAYLASYVPWMIRNRHEEAVMRIVRIQLEAFVTNMLLKYDTTLPVGLGGSLASIFRDEITEIAGRHGLVVEETVADLAPKIVEYHLEEK